MEVIKMEDDGEYYYSLCQVVGNSYMKLLRLADYLGKSITQPRKLYPNDLVEWDHPEITLISKAPESYGEENQLGVWKWNLYDGKQYSYAISCRFYELISIKSLSNNDTEIDICDLFDQLIQGMAISFEIRIPFLLGIAIDDTNHLCFEISAESCVITKENKLRLIEGRKLKLYRLPKSDFINTGDSFNKLSTNNNWNIQFISRTVYLRYPIHGSPITTVEIHPFSTYLKEYLTYLLEKISYPSEIKEIMNDILAIGDGKIDNFKMYIQAYAGEVPEHLLSAYVKKYIETTTFLKDYLDDKNQESKFLTQLIEGTPELREKYLAVLLSDYVEMAKTSAIEKIKDTTNELANLQSQKNTLEMEIKCYQEDAQKLSDENIKIQDENVKLGEINKSLRESLSENTKDIFKGLIIVKELLSVGISNDLVDNSPNIHGNVNSIQRIIKRPVFLSEINDESVDEIANINELVEQLEENLNYQGFETKDRLSIAKLIAGSYLLHVPILCVGYSAQEMADVISLSLSAQKAEIFCFPTGFNDYASLLTTIKNSNSEYVILENLVGFAEEYCYLHLPQDIPEKHIILTIDYKDTLKILPSDIYSYLLFIDCDRYYVGSNINSEIIYGRVKDIVDIPKANVEIRRTNSTLLKKLLEGSPISSGYIHLRLQLLNIFALSDTDSTIPILYPELESILSVMGCSDDYKDYLESKENQLLNEFGKRLDKIQS